MFGTAAELTRILSGELDGPGTRTFDGLSTDSRSIGAGEMFVAIRGPRFDGHSFASDVLAKGAAGVIVGREWNGRRGRGVVIRVKDTRKALGDAARYWRRKRKALVIGVTGSCGKTTTKEMIYSILSRKAPTLKNHANLNNYFGLSQTLLRLRDEKYAVIEAGINNRGEMAELAAIALPDFGIVTNIAPVHLEGLGSLDAVYEEKKLLLDRSTRAVFLNAADVRLKNYAPGRRDCVSFGTRGMVAAGDVVLRHVDGMVFTLRDRREGRERHRMYLPYAGAGLAANAAAAAAVGRYAGASWDEVREGIETLSLPGMRMEVLRSGRARVILDAYNASPLSMNSALATLDALDGRRKSVVLGDMRELGRRSKYYHAMLGRRLVAGRYYRVFLVGREMAEAWEMLIRAGAKNVRHYENAGELTGDFRRLTRESDLILVKGSRGMRLEILIGERRDAV